MGCKCGTCIFEKRNTMSFGGAMCTYFIITMIERTFWFLQIEHNITIVKDWIAWNNVTVALPFLVYLIFFFYIYKGEKR